MNVRRYVSASLLVVVGTVGAVAQGPPHATRTFSSPADYVPDPKMLNAALSELRDLVTRFRLDRAAILRFYVITGSPTRIARLETFYDAWLETLRKVDFDGLSQEGKADYVLLRTRIDYEIALLGREGRVQRDIGPLLPFSADIIALAENRQRLDFIASDAAVKALTDISTKVTSAAAAATTGSSISPATAVRAAREVDTLTDALNQWFTFFNGYDPAFTTAVPKPYESLTQALGAYARTLREKVAGLPTGAGRRDSGGRGGQTSVGANEGPIIGDPIGRDGMFEDLRGEMIPYTPEQLIEIGNREYGLV